MRTSKSTQTRVLALQPSTRTIGFAVMEGSTRPIDWGLKFITPQDRNKQFLKLTEILLELYQPAVLVVEDCQGKGSRRHPQIENLVEGVIQMASAKRLRVCRLSRSQIRQTFDQAKNKHQVATVIAKRLPFLEPKLPGPRKIWLPEHYVMSLFDAFAFALSFYHLSQKHRLAA